MSIPESLYAYPSSTYWDDMAWGATWLYLATKNNTYLQEAQEFFTLAETDGNFVAPTPLAWNWDNQLPGVAFLLANISQWENVTLITQVRSLLIEFSWIWSQASHSANDCACSKAHIVL